MKTVKPRGHTGVRLAVAGVLCAATASPAIAQNFSNFWVFGDSLSDAGTYRLNAANGDVPANYGLHYTTNPAAEWDQILGAKYGFTITPAYAVILNGENGPSINTANGSPGTPLGGTNYAQGGACVGSAYTNATGLTTAGQYVCHVNQNNTLGVQQQIANYLELTGGKADPDALYTVYAGGNDILNLYYGGGYKLAGAAASLTPIGTEEAGNVQTLLNAGARYVIVPTLADVGKTPAAALLNKIDPGISATFTSAVANYNNALDAGLARIGGQSIIWANLASLVNEIIANPTPYGITNVTSSACGVTGSALYCFPAEIAAQGNPASAATTWLFADGVHPTAAGQLGVAEYMEALLSAPGQIALLAEQPIYVGRGLLRALDARTAADIRLGTGYSSWASIDYSASSLATTTTRAGYDGNTTGGYAGLDYGFGNGLLVGIAVGANSGSYSLGGAGGGWDSDMVVGSLYGSFSRAGLWAQGSVGIGATDDTNITRLVPILADTRAESGQTDGRYSQARLIGGYDWTADRLTLTPLAGLTYQVSQIAGYAENASDSSSMDFGSQRQKYFFATVGARTAFDIDICGTRVTPNAEASFNHDFGSLERSVNAAIEGAPVSFSLPVYAPGKNWATISGGAKAALSGAVSVDLTGGGQVSGGIDNAFGNIALQVRF